MELEIIKKVSFMKLNFKKRITSTFLLVLVCSLSFAQITTKKVTFPQGKSETVVNGSIKGEQTIDYTVNLSEGQEFKVSIKTISTSCYFNILAPGSNDEAIFIGSNDGNTFGGTLGMSGTYKIRVYLYRNAARRDEVANFSLSISATGGSANSNSSDAKVSGTNFNAAGELRAANGSTSSKATFGVIRSNGEAEVHATITGGLKRIFVFSKGEWSCKTEGCKLIFAKISSDEWELIVNDYEKYYIPDAVIYGG